MDLKAYSMNVPYSGETERRITEGENLTKTHTVGEVHSNMFVILHMRTQQNKNTTNNFDFQVFLFCGLKQLK